MTRTALSNKQTKPRDTSLSFLWLPIATSVVPIIGIHISLVLSIISGAIEPCLPYLQGCASISATGRSAPATYVFKPVMTTQWLLLLAYWALCVRWARQVHDPKRSQLINHAMFWLGATGALALVIYVTFLGTGEPFYQFMRRTGIYGYFLGTVVALALSGLIAIRAGKRHRQPKLTGLGQWQVILAAAPFVLGIINLTFKAVWGDVQWVDRTENAIEWIAAALMQLGIAISYLIWKQSGFSRYDTPSK